VASQDWFEKDFYAVLAVDKSVSQADLKKAYRKLARQYHPDSNPGDAKAEARFKEISEAYSVLSDEEQRQEYDQIRAMGSGARFTAGGAGGQGGGGFEDVFGNLFGQGTRTRTSTRGGGGFEDILGGILPPGARSPRRRASTSSPPRRATPSPSPAATASRSPSASRPA
jgi:molecular chaperone DnaJ